MRPAAAIAMMLAVASPVAAQDEAPPRYLTCVDDTIRSNLDNPFVDLLAIVTCGERYAPPRHSCVGLQYMMRHTAASCEEQDHAYWSGQLALWQARLDAEGGQESSLMQPGLERCAEEPENVLVCETEVYWREVLGFMSNETRLAIFGPANP
ncbi:hypothetical protein [Yoonia sp. 208BN28-4]|uniref:hypothetical protein n=1 Tax=Yoonia sp. 208BN28-4 TaxID=3126505 RepID=UPI00309FD2D5